jgi:hypothetical protein
MFRSALWLLPLIPAFVLPTNIAAQGLDDLTGAWALDRSVSTFGPGDPGAERVDILVSPTEVTVRRIFNPQGPGSVWTLPLDGSTLPPPRDRGSALPVDGKLVITHKRTREVVTHVYTVEGDTLFVERSINTISRDTPDLRHTMVFRRIR